MANLRSNLGSRIAGALIWIIGAACVLPVLYMFAGAFCDAGRPSLANVTQAFSDPARTALLLHNSLAVTLGCVAVALGLGTPLGFLCFRTNMPLRRGVILGCLVATCIPVYVIMTCWMALAGMPLWLYRAGSAAWMGGLTWTPLATLITGTGFALADRELEDLASLDANRAGVLRHSTLPLGLWGVAVAAMTVAILSLWDITLTDIFMVRTFPEEIFTQFQLGAGPWRAAAASLPMLLISATLTLATVTLVIRRCRITLDGAFYPPRILDLGRWKHIAAGVVILGACGLYAIPFAALVRAVGSLQNLVTAGRACSEELAGTLWVTPLAATVSTATALGAAWALLRMPRARWPVGAALLLLLSTPGPVAGMGIATLMNQPGWLGALYDTRAPVILAFVLRALPFAVLALLPALQRIPVELEHAARLDGAGWLTYLRTVVAPMSWKMLLVAWLLSAVIALSELGASFLVTPPGKATLTIRFFTLIHYGVYPDAAAMCLILLGSVALAGTITGWTVFGLYRPREA